MQESGEMYLKSIYQLAEKQERVIAKDISIFRGFSKPSVSRALSILKEDNYITIDNRGSIRLTEEGERIAVMLLERSTVLTEIFVSLGVDPQTAESDADRIEHSISDETFQALKKAFLQAKAL